MNMEKNYKKLKMLKKKPERKDKVSEMMQFLMGAILNQAQSLSGRLVLQSEKVKSRYFMRVQYGCDDILN